MTHKDRNLEVGVRQLFCFLRLFGFAGGSDFRKWNSGIWESDKLGWKWNFQTLRKRTFMNSVWILFWENFYNYMLRNIFFEDRKLKIIALIYRRFDLIAFCVELTLRFWQTFRILRAEIAFRQSWKRRAESLFEANLRHSTESKTTENKLYENTPNP